MATSHFVRAFQSGFHAAWTNRLPIVVIQFLIAGIVVGFYFVPEVQTALDVLGRWQVWGGVWFAAASNAGAGGILSEVVLVYALQSGMWTKENGDRLLFKILLFGVSGAITFEFYRLQAVLFGSGHEVATVVKKVLVDQFVFSVFWSAPFQALVTQWKNYGYSWGRLARELHADLLWDQIITIIAATWMFWLPTVTLVHMMPVPLQVPMAVFSNAIWAILLIAISARHTDHPVMAETDVIAELSSTEI